MMIPSAPSHGNRFPREKLTETLGKFPTQQKEPPHRPPKTVVRHHLTSSQRGVETHCRWRTWRVNVDA